MENVLVHFRESIAESLSFKELVSPLTSVVFIGTEKFNLKRDFLTFTYYLNLNLEILQEAVLHKWNLT